MKKFMIMVLDTETCPIENLDTVDAHNMLTYDFGYSIVDLQGNVYLERSYIVADVFFGEKEKMQSAYYANKIAQYELDIASGKRKVRTWNEISWIVKQDVEKYGVNKLCAHNAYFDYTTLKTTKDYLNNNNYLVPKLEWWDSQKMVSSTIFKKASYKKFCQQNEFMTNHKVPRPQVKAEVVYKYLTNDLEFIESHTGLEDVQIEREIMWACFKMHKKMEKKLWKNS